MPIARFAAATRMVAAREEILEAQMSPAVFRVCDDIARELLTFPDVGEPDVAKLLNPLILMTVLFVKTRMDLSVGHEPAIAYLFDEPNRSPSKGKKRMPVAAVPSRQRDHFERGLQNDYASFIGSGLPGTSIEVSDIASGRADVVVSLHGTRIAIEVKREDADASHDALHAAYAGQATEYSNTNVRIGFLLVIDMSRGDGIGGHLTEKFTVRSVTKGTDAEPRGLIIAVVPGRRRRPSAVRIAAPVAHSAGSALDAPSSRETNGGRRNKAGSVVWGRSPPLSPRRS